MNLKSFVGFLGHHIGDLRSVANVAGSLLDAVPVNAQDRARIETQIAKLQTAADNIAESIKRASTSTSDDLGKGSGTSTGGTKAPTDAQIAKALDKALPDALAAYFKANPPHVPAPVIAPGTPGPDARTAGEDAVSSDGTSPTDQTRSADGKGETITA